MESKSQTRKILSFKVKEPTLAPGVGSAGRANSFVIGGKLAISAWREGASVFYAFASTKIVVEVPMSNVVEVVYEA